MVDRFLNNVLRGDDLETGSFESDMSRVGVMVYSVSVHGKEWVALCVGSCQRQCVTGVIRLSSSTMATEDTKTIP